MDFLLMVKFEGVDKQLMLGDPAKRINAEYMERYGSMGARTFFVLELEGPWDVAIRYEGPEESAPWLEGAIMDASRSFNGSARTGTVHVVSDITSRY